MLGSSILLVGGYILLSMEARYAGHSLESQQRVRGLLAAPLDQLAVSLLSEYIAPANPESVSRINVIATVCQRLGVGGPERIATGRLVAEGWQLLERRGLICRDPEQKQGDWWFLTRAGETALGRPDLGSFLQEPNGH